MVWIPGGTFVMGSDHHYPEEAPAHRVTVDGFWMDRHTVTNHQFAPVDMRNHYSWWTYVPGADWRHPQGPGSSVKKSRTIRWCTCPGRTSKRTRGGGGRSCRLRPSGSSRHAAA
jgi:formylglycine-generating enzyme required for sulfatase activity